MSPSQKADDLIEEFYNFIFSPERYQDEIIDDTIDCCEVIVDEIIKEVTELEKLTFWKQVKDELWQRRKKK